MTAPDPRWDKAARRWLEQMRSPRNAIQGEWAQSLTALLARVAEEATAAGWVERDKDWMMAFGAAEMCLDFVPTKPTELPRHIEEMDDQITAAHADGKAAGRAEMREEAAKKCEYIYDHGLAGAHQGEMCNRVAKAIRSLPTAKSAKAEVGNVEAPNPTPAVFWPATEGGVTSLPRRLHLDICAVPNAYFADDKGCTCGLRDRIYDLAAPKPGGEALPLPEFPSKDPSDHPYEDWLTNKERADYPAVPPSRCIRCGYPAGVHGR